MPIPSPPSSSWISPRSLHSATSTAHLVVLRLHIYSLRARIQLTRKRSCLEILLLRLRLVIRRIVLRIRSSRRGTHARARHIIHRLTLRLPVRWHRHCLLRPDMAWPCVPSLLWILPSVHGQRVGARRVAGGRNRAGRPCLLAVCDTHGRHAGTLLLHGWGVVWRW